MANEDDSIGALKMIEVTPIETGWAVLLDRYGTPRRVWAFDRQEEVGKAVTDLLMGRDPQHGHPLDND